MKRCSPFFRPSTQKRAAQLKFHFILPHTQQNVFPSCPSLRDGSLRLCVLWPFPQRTAGLLLLVGFHCKDTCPRSPAIFMETSTVCWLHPDFQIPRSSSLWYISNVLKRKQCFVTGTICRTPDTLTVISCHRVFPYNSTSLPQVSVFFSAVRRGRYLLTGSFWRCCPAGAWKKWAPL